MTPNKGSEAPRILSTLGNEPSCAALCYFLFTKQERAAFSILTVSPGSPMGPGSPDGPGIPWSPCSPFSPVGPSRPYRSRKICGVLYN